MPMKIAAALFRLQLASKNINPMIIKSPYISSHAFVTRFASKD
ncbi:hypothetical protein [Levilactobacillus yiduensis]|nr:hypothetical protein [Levilactobacillus yiduensis]